MRYTYFMHLRRVRRAADVPARAWWMWGAAAGFYFMAMFHRMGLGVASLEAGDRLGLGVETVALLSALRLGLYMALVIPAGLAADRIGPRRTLAGGMALVAVGEVAFGFAHSAAPALAGRGLVGIGDAFIFLSVLRMAQNWFPARRYAPLALLTATVGALGQIFATVPLGGALDVLGWEPVFVGTGLLAGVAAVAGALLMRDRPEGAATAGGAAPTRGQGPGILTSIGLAWRARGTRRAFWTHFGLMGPFVAVTALWGYPYLVDGRGMAEGQARAWVLGCVVVCAVASPIMASIVAREPSARVPLTIGTSLVVAALWTATLLWPGGSPLAVALTALLLTGATCAAAMLAFEFAREGNPPERVGTATGVANTGGFGAAVMVQLAGSALLNALGDPPDYDLALLPLPGLMFLGAFHMIRHARRASRPAPALPGKGTAGLDAVESG